MLPLSDDDADYLFIVFNLFETRLPVHQDGPTCLSPDPERFYATNDKCKCMELLCLAGVHDAFRHAFNPLD